MLSSYSAKAAGIVVCAGTPMADDGVLEGTAYQDCMGDASVCSSGQQFPVSRLVCSTEIHCGAHQVSRQISRRLCLGQFHCAIGERAIFPPKRMNRGVGGESGEKMAGMGEHRQSGEPPGSRDRFCNE